MIDPWQHPIFEQTLQQWQGIVDLVVRIAGVRAGLIMRAYDDDIAVLVASRNAGNPYEVGEKEKLLGSGLYCERVIATQEKLLVPNALKSAEWRNNPDIKKHMISYLGFPIRLPGRRPFGTLCVLDDRENEYSSDVMELMEKMRDLIESHLRLDERLLLQENAWLFAQLQDELAERARVEAELEQHRAHLEKLVQTRTAELWAEIAERERIRQALAERVQELSILQEQNALLHQQTRARAAGLEEAVAERTLELQTERNRTQAILETVGESVVVTDLDGQVLFLNPATEALTGFSRDETLGQPIWQRWSAQALRDRWPQAQRALGNGQPWHGEVAGYRKDGSLYTVALIGAPLYDERAAPQVTGGVWVQRDITSLKEAERLKDQFVSNVSHELRTPISIIALSCDNLNAFYDGLSESQRRQLLSDIHEQAHLLGDLVEDILTLSRIDSGRLSSVRSRVDLAQLVGAEVARQQPLAEQRSLRLSYAPAAPVVVLGNEMQLQRVVRNLLDNAIKYTPAGGQIRCTCAVRAGVPAASALPPGVWAVVEVVDGGIGIPAEALPLLFERFYRVNAEGEVAGAGLGLPIARELIVLHGGWIDVKSVLGQGSTFTVYLPMVEG